MHQFPANISLGHRDVSNNAKPYFIAEIGSNFDRSLKRAKELIRISADSGADAAKFQHYTSSSLVSDFAFGQLPNKSHQSSWVDSVSLTYEKASLNHEWTQELKLECDRYKIDFMTSPYSFELCDIVDQYVQSFKIGSGDISYSQLIVHIAKKSKPILLATGASSCSDVCRAVDLILSHNRQIILMQCNTDYTGSDDIFDFTNLNVLRLFDSLYPGIIKGFSDHSPGHSAVLGAIALGARVIEKHFTDDCSRSGPDHSFALNPIAFSNMVTASSQLYRSLGRANKIVETNELDTAIVQRRSLCAASNLAAGEIISEDSFIALRPCPTGALQPYDSDCIIGKRLKRDVSAGEVLYPNYLS